MPKTALRLDSGELEHTSIVPALECPVPEHQNLIWCSSFQLAWNKAKSMGMEIQGEVPDLLNKSDVSSGDLHPGSFYVSAEPYTADAIKTVHRELDQQFAAPEPLLLKEMVDEAPDLIFIYAYLMASVRFEFTFLDLPAKIDFTDSKGLSHKVSGFGIPRDRSGSMGEAPMQVILLYVNPENNEFVLDLSAHTQPYQLLVAKTPLRQTLAKTLEELDRKIWDPTRRMMLLPGASLSVPNMDFDIRHSFEELKIGPVAEALQRIRLKLNRHGAELESEAEVRFIGVGAGDYGLDGPFLIRMQKRDSQRPCFVMWVDNTELMS